MRQIPLTQGHFALVDEEDYPWLKQYRWHYLRPFYASRRRRVRGKYISEPMHRVILGLKYKDGKHTDHIDGNGFNNQRCNLRICSHQQNVFNQKPRKGTSEYKGVYRNKQKGKWQSQITVNRKEIYLGAFNNEKEAAVAYNMAAVKYFGEFARLNNV